MKIQSLLLDYIQQMYFKSEPRYCCRCLFLWWSFLVFLWKYQMGRLKEVVHILDKLENAFQGQLHFWRNINIKMNINAMKHYYISYFLSYPN